MTRKQWLDELESANFFGSDNDTQTIRAMFDQECADDAQDMEPDARDAECQRAIAAAVSQFNLYQAIKQWRTENPDTTGIWPRVDLETMQLVGTQDGNWSSDGSSSDTVDWEIVYLGSFIEDVAVRVTE